MRSFQRTAFGVLALAVAAACGQGPSLEVRDARLPVPAGDQAAVYLTVVDGGGAGDRLVGAATDVAGGAMLHETRHREGRVSMAPVEGFEVPPRGELVLRPGGGHVMLHGLRRELTPGDRVDLELVFEDTGRVRVEVPVVEAAQATRR